MLPADARLEAAWPRRGGITFRNVCLRYRPEAPLVLSGLTLEVPAGEKVGICGRTGAGKSSVLMALFRIVEMEAGRIEIDGVDVRALGLHTLRSRLSIVPQDPVLFSGSVRYNMDPFNQYDDAAIAAALATVQLRDKFPALDAKVLTTSDE